MITAVIDVNVLVSAVLSARGNPRHVLIAWQAERFLALTSEGIIAEVEAKLRAPKIGGAHGVTTDGIGWMRSLLTLEAKVVPVRPQDVIPVTGDPEDDYVLATARLSAADYLVTGDHGLLTLLRHHDTRIVSPREFLEFLADA